MNFPIDASEGRENNANVEIKTAARNDVEGEVKQVASAASLVFPAFKSHKARLVGFAEYNETRSYLILMRSEKRKDQSWALVRATLRAQHARLDLIRTSADVDLKQSASYYFLPKFTVAKQTQDVIDLDKQTPTEWQVPLRAKK
ncbi:MAG TPA: hypothetical protein VEJ63_14000 [Planctomycetota bacterium]|nr:hypothetical protein [Planctomycetota bacterium]